MYCMWKERNNFQAEWMNCWSHAMPWSGINLWRNLHWLSGSCGIVINELSPLSEHQRDWTLFPVSPYDHKAHEPSWGKRWSIGSTSWSTDPIIVIRSQESLVGHLGGAPVGSQAIVAGTIVCAIFICAMSTSWITPWWTKCLKGCPPERQPGWIFASETQKIHMHAGKVPQ